jgi:hypothetical protein
VGAEQYVEYVNQIETLIGLGIVVVILSALANIFYARYCKNRIILEFITFTRTIPRTEKEAEQPLSSAFRTDANLSRVKTQTLEGLAQLAANHAVTSLQGEHVEQQRQIFIQLANIYEKVEGLTEPTVVKEECPNCHQGQTEHIEDSPLVKAFRAAQKKPR